MPPYLYKYLFINLLYFFTALLPASAQVTLSDSTGQYSIGRQVAVLEDPTHQIRTLDQVVREPYRSQFIQSIQETPNRGYSTADYWVRFDLTDRAKPGSNWLLEIGFGNFSEVDLYVISNKTGRVIHKRGGESLGKRSREISYNTYVFHLPTEPGDKQTVYVRLSSMYGQATFPIYLWRTDAFVQIAQLSGLLWGLYYGILLSVFLYHLSLLILVKDREYIPLLTLYLGAYILWELSRGYCLGVRFLWPNNAWLINHSLSTFFTIMISSFLLFYSSVLNLKTVAPRLNSVVYALVGFSGVGWLVTLLNLPGVSKNLVVTSVGLVDGLFIIFLGAYAWRLGQQPARYYWAAAVCLVLGGIFLGLNRSGAIPGDHFFVQYTLNFGSVLEFIFLTIGLADTRRVEKKQKEALRREMVYREEVAEVRGVTEERERVSSEIHDNVGNLLLTLRQSLRGAHDETGMAVEYEKLEQIVQDTYEEVRKIVNNLLPDEFQKKGLSAVLQEQVDTLNETGQTQFFLLPPEPDTRLRPGTQFQLYLIITELVNNIIKHARASEASIRFVTTNRILTVTIRDNGVGLPLLSKLASGQGWHTIRNRLTRIGGSIHIDKLIEKGTSVVVHVPLTEAPD